MKLLHLAAALLLAASVAAESRKPWPVPAEARQRKNSVEATADSLRQGQRLYREHCLLCHGEKGDGNGPWREKLATDPSDFTDTKRMNSMTDGELFWKMTKGRVLMPGFENQLSERQRWIVVNYLRTMTTPQRRDDP